MPGSRGEFPSQPFFHHLSLYLLKIFASERNLQRSCLQYIIVGLGEVEFKILQQKVSRIKQADAKKLSKFRFSYVIKFHASRDCFLCLTTKIRIFL